MTADFYKVWKDAPAHEEVAKAADELRTHGATYFRLTVLSGDSYLLEGWRDERIGRAAPLTVEAPREH